MPVPPFARQAGVSSWFDTGAARLLLREERLQLAARLRARPSQPWLWLAPAPFGQVPKGLGGLCVRLHQLGGGAGYGGDIRCSLPLPVASESVQAIVLQHVLDHRADALLRECERVLMPGGRIWLLALNPLSPYRLRWRRHGLGARLPASWRVLANRCGLQAVGPVQYLGPVWRNDGGRRGGRDLSLLRAACLLEAEKRAAAPIGLMPAKVQWRQPMQTT